MKSKILLALLMAGSLSMTTMAADQNQTVKQIQEEKELVKQKEANYNYWYKPATSNDSPKDFYDNYMFVLNQRWLTLSNVPAFGGLVGGVLEKNKDHAKDFLVHFKNLNGIEQRPLIIGIISAKLSNEDDLLKLISEGFSEQDIELFKKKWGRDGFAIEHLSEIDYLWGRYYKLRDQKTLLFLLGLIQINNPSNDNKLALQSFQKNMVLHKEIKAEVKRIYKARGLIKNKKDVRVLIDSVEDILDDIKYSKIDMRKITLSDLD